MYKSMKPKYVHCSIPYDSGKIEATGIPNSKILIYKILGWPGETILFRQENSCWRRNLTTWENVHKILLSGKSSNEATERHTLVFMEKVLEGQEAKS